MSIVNMLAWWQWLVLLAIPPLIVLLYFLKLKRQPLEVPSTYLWSRTIEDLHVNSIWQRLRQSLLLFLQLLLILLVILTLLRPSWRGTTLTGNRFIFLVDTSASMSATDVAPTRLEEAKEKALRYISQMSSGDAAMIISCSDVAKVEQPFTSNRNLLRRKLNEIEPTRRATDFGEALRYAAGLANPSHTRLEGDDQVDEAQPATLYLFTDGGLEAISNFSLGNLDPVYVPIGAVAPRNVGIVAFTTERNPEKPGQIQAFGRLENSGPEDVTTNVKLELNGALVDATQVTIPAGGFSGAEFALQEVENAELTFRVDHEDDLKEDNVAHSAINSPRKAEVLLITPYNKALRMALQTTNAGRLANVTFAGPELLKDKKYRQDADTGAYDLIIYDQCVPETMPQANTLFIAALPSNEKWSAGETKGPLFIVDTDRVHPLMQFLDLGKLRIVEGFLVKPPEGATVLIDSQIGPLFCIAPRQGFEDAVLGMAINTIKEDGTTQPNTDWPIRRSFPVFVLNAVRYLGGSRGALANTTVRPGSPIEIRSHAPVDKVTVRSPDGQRATVRREGQNTFVFTGTEQPGIYAVTEGADSEIAQRFSVNLFDSRESNLAVAPTLDFDYEKVEGTTATEVTRRELWKWILILGLCILLFEWYVYNRRVYL
jgi:hypothetical protein